MLRPLCLALVLGLSLAASGCPRNHGDLDGPYCEDTRTDVAIGDASALGFSGADLVALAISPSPWSDTLTWHEGGETGFTLTLAGGTTARHVESAAVYPDGGMALDIAIECFDRIEVDADATFVSDDGSFDEAWPVVLESTDGLTTRFAKTLDPFALGGTFDVMPLITEPDWDDVDLWIAASFDGEVTWGEVHGQVSGTEECAGNECTGWAMDMPVATWGENSE